MPYISPKGRQTAPIWVIANKPYSSDVPKGQMFSGGLGFVFEKMLLEAGISPSDCYFTCRAPDTDTPMGFQNMEGLLNTFKPPFILALGDVAGWFLSELRGKDKAPVTDKGQLQKYAGSMMECANLSYPHYMLPLYGPDRCVQDWTERNVTTFIDLQKLRDELVYFRKHGVHQPLPQRVLKYDDMELDELLSYLDRFHNAKRLANDIENPVYNSKKYKHPGYPFLLGLADSPLFGISFKLFRDTPAESRVLWRKLNEVLHDVPIIGQNFFNYDAWFERAIGFRIQLDKVQDTLIRHHILWPELSHKLAFLTRQYTREPYYKDEGHGWTMKMLNKYRRYNALDACVTYEVYEGQEEEFINKPHLA